MLQGHGGGKGGYGFETVGVNLLDERGYQRAGSTHKQADKTGEGRGQENTGRPERGFGQFRAPAKIQHEAGNGQLPEVSGKVEQYPGTQGRPRHNTWRKGENHPPVDMAKGQYSPAGVRAQLDHAVDRNNRRWRNPGGHQHQQQYTTTGAQHGSQHGGNGGGRQQE